MVRTSRRLGRRLRGPQSVVDPARWGLRVQFFRWTNSIHSMMQQATPVSLPTSPIQPATGPGGGAYPYDGVIARHYGPEPDGTVDPTGYWIVEPEVTDETNAVDALAPFPLVIFFHEYAATEPEHYRAWISTSCAAARS